ncbi:NAD(P)-binding protein [Pleurostoma richardsiae]|uniref:NAD(P)-binding protein n=1 Tax=Pleurostoma richardsiae TaxID=41990 RepID=A0AA38RFC1_9PEZI|nr:NAD(P)-binding protein [Pleurostoma richardsiae]
MAPSVLVVGAGELGTAVLEALSRHSKREGGKIAVLLRSSSIASQDSAKQASNAHIRSLGVDFEAGNFVSDPVSALAATFKKYDVVVQCGGYGMPPGIQVRVTQAALEAGVPRYFPWQFGVDYDAIGKGSSQELFDEMLEVRRMLRAQSGTHWTIVSTGLFMSYLFLPDFGVDLKRRTVRALGGWENRVTVTIPKDIGVMVAEMVYVPGENTLDRVVLIGGDTITYGQLADALDAAYGTKFERELLDVPTLRKKLAEDPGNIWLKYRNVFADGVGVAWDKEKMLNYQRNIPLTGLEKYIEENKEHLA